MTIPELLHEEPDDDAGASGRDGVENSDGCVIVGSTQAAAVESDPACEE
jgi:hypothetical protein